MDLHDRIARAGGHVDAPDLAAELRARLHVAVVEELGPQLADSDASADERRQRVRNALRNRLTAERGLSAAERDGLLEDLTDDVLGNGPLERLLNDDTITEIMVNGPRDVWIERAGRLSRTPVRFADEAHLRHVMNRIVNAVGRRIDEASPMVDARLPDGSRVNAIVPPLSLDGPLMTIRRFGADRLTMADMVRLGSVTQDVVEFLDCCLRARLNILISGGTGSGKTTLLNALSSSIPSSERIITIEDAAELQLNQDHVLRLESRPSNIEGEGEVRIRDLVRNALRMRPDRIIVGEVRGAEALDMLQAMNTGHDGSLSTVHANAPRDALARVETMVLMAGYDLPLRAIRQQVASSLDLIVHVERFSDGSRRVTQISEVLRMEGEIITMQELFEFDASGASHASDGVLRPTQLRPCFLPKFHMRDITPPPAMLAPAERVTSIQGRMR